MMSKIFPTNEHTIDRGLRIALGLFLLSMTFVGPRALWGLVGIVPLLTGILGSCPLYTVLGLSTCSLKTNQTTKA